MKNEEQIRQKLALVGEASSAPEDPVEGIPGQWLPVWLRFLLRLAILPFLWIDQVAQKVAKRLIPPPFVKVGSCLKRGNCCHYILYPKPEGVMKKLILCWNLQVNGFYLRHTQAFFWEGKEMVVMGCRFLKQDGSCSNYFLRPSVCREWPRIEQFGYPEILKGCGFKAIARDSRYAHLIKDENYQVFKNSE